MSSRQPQPRRRRVLIALLLAVAATSLALVAEGLGQSSAPRVRALPLLGAADPEMTLMGSAPQGTAGEAWGYRQLPLTVGSVRAGARALEFGPTSSTRPESQLVFLRHTSVTGWQVYETPLDEGGRPYRGFSANELSARTTPRGGGVLVGRDTQRPAQAPADRPGDSPQIVVLARDPAGRYRVRPGPDEPPENGSAAPSGILAPGEALAEGAGSGRVAITAFDDGAHTGLFAAPTFAGSGPAPQPAILRNARNAGNDGFTWTREPIDAPAGVDLQVIALGATSTSNAWALAREPERVDGLPRRRGVILLQRSTDADGKPRWREADLGAQVFEDAQTPASGVLGVAPLADAAQPLTVTGNGLWIDGRLTASGVPRDFTLFYSREAARVTGSWCDASVCDRPLGARFNSRDGYRSFAWAGPGFGTRAITNGLEAGGDERTNRGTYLRFADDSDDAFERRPGGGGNFRSSGAFASVDDGWLEGPVRVGTSGPPPRPPAWPVSLRAPLADVTPQPGATPGRRGSRALAAGSDGGVARFIPGRGWQREFLLTSSGSVSKSALRGVAWPEPNRAHAVGDIGAMWQWNADTDLWEVDPGTPVAFEGNLMDVAFDRNDSDRGYAVGKSGVLLRYGKSWEQETLPAAQRGRDLTQIAFAGSQALVAAEGDLLINSGGGWRVDPGVKALLDRVRTASPRIFAVAGLPDGGAIAAGRDFVLERDGPRSPWRFSDQPLPNSTVIAAAAVRAGPRVRAVVSVAPRLPYPPPDLIDTPDPNVPPPIVPPFPLPGDGYVLRETADGWSDQQRSSFFGSDNDRPLKTDPILSFALDSAGTGWAVGGWGGDSDSAGRGSSARNADGRATRE
nr:hypothetical protein [Thermoleophilaceae bacterium]